ncbi:pentapeptide repeat-containing protein [Nostoc sp. CHAB 5844]|nr:pentapeptide repeat-containing protein [Nostoc sp. CHAB 5844]
MSNLILWIVDSQEKQHYVSQTSIKKRLMMAVTQLHHQTVDRRLKAILELEKLATSHCQYNWEIIEILTAFVRKTAPHKTYEECKAISVFMINPEIQASLRVISRSGPQKSSEFAQIDLSYTDLRGTNLSEANFAGANLYQANLSGVNLAGANLTGAILSAANLSETNLAGANLSDAIISAANLSKANLVKANLSRANFYLANLEQANLQDAMLDGANLREAKFSRQ